MLTAFAMHWLIPKLISAVLLLPLNLLLLGGLGILLLRRRPRLGRTLIIVAWLSLWAFSTPIISSALLHTVERIPPLRWDQLPPDAEAIVVLGSGTYCQAPEYGEDSVTAYALERLRYAAELYRQTGKPILVTGGKLNNSTAEATFMKKTLEHDFHVPVQWTEDRSHNTMENARFSYEVLQPRGVTRIYLVTHAAHMPRAQLAFEKAGFQVVPAPTKFTTRCKLTLLDFLPSSYALFASADALYEWIGLLWYQFR